MTAARVLDRRTLLARAGLLAAAAAIPRPARAAATRIAALIARMTIEEKAGQLSCFNDEIRPVGAVFNPVVNAQGAAAQLADIRAGRIGMLFNGYGAQGAIRAQEAALASRLRIPLLFAADLIHGCRTIFPIPLGEAAAFDIDLSRRVARAVAVEARAAGIHWTFAPVVDVARDQRWGRVAEGAGEDVALNVALAVARVRGFQGAGLARADALAATPKHFAGYAEVRGGMEYGAVDMSDAHLREVVLPPFAAAFRAGAAATMAAFTAFNGIPATANRHLLTDILREDLGFTGVCVSDYDADRELIAHGVAADEADAARLAILAGIDMSMQSGLFQRHLPALVARGAVPVAVVDRAVARVLALKDAFGLFDDPFRGLCEPAAPPPTALAREAATRSIVLLRNDGAVLPLAPATRVALIGPFGADRTHLNGPWSFAGRAEDGVDLATAIRPLLVEPGSGIHHPLPGGIDRAVAAARAADVVLLAIGEGADMSGEGNSRVAITVPAAQQALAEAVAATGKPLVILLRHGRALALEGAVRDAPAILATWFLGAGTGHAVADILFGRAEPSGRLPVSFPFATGQQPWSYDRPATGRPAPDDAPLAPGRAHWRDAPDRALFPFGAGLSYTRFALDRVRVAATVPFGAPVPVSLRVRNIGPRPGLACIRLDIHDRVASRIRPVWQMKRWLRLSLAPHAARHVTFTLTPDDLALITPTGHPSLEPGAFDIRLSEGMEATAFTSFTVTPHEAPILEINGGSSVP